jgi:uncharacterized protein YeaO (DUF488 family)
MERLLRSLGANMGTLQIKRVYEQRSPTDGRRVLVDRVWPRGISKEKLREVTWLKDVAPSTELRKWFDHRTERWKLFRARYFAELDRNPAVEQLRTICGLGPVTLLYSARDVKHNQAQVLSEYLADTVSKGTAPPVRVHSKRGRPTAARQT